MRRLRPLTPVPAAEPRGIDPSNVVRPPPGTAPVVSDPELVQALELCARQDPAGLRTILAWQNGRLRGQLRRQVEDERQAARAMEALLADIWHNAATFSPDSTTAEDWIHARLRHHARRVSHQGAAGPRPVGLPPEVAAEIGWPTEGRPAPPPEPRRLETASAPPPRRTPSDYLVAVDIDPPARPRGGWLVKLLLGSMAAASLAGLAFWWQMRASPSPPVVIEQAAEPREAAASPPAEDERAGALVMLQDSLAPAPSAGTAPPAASTQPPAPAPVAGTPVPRPRPAPAVAPPTSVAALDGGPVRVVIHYTALDPEAETLAQDLADRLEAEGPIVAVTIPVGVLISRPSVRYFHAGDDDAAGIVADLAAKVLSSAGQPSAPDAVDFSYFRPLPRERTVEIWLARQS